MIKCDGCRRYFHGDDVRECGNCGAEFCNGCFPYHNCSDHEEPYFEFDE